MLMVENFTPTEEETYINDVENITTIEDTFEATIKEEVKKIGIPPSQSVIDRILQYSKSFGKK